MKLAFSSNAFRRYSLIETIDILADIGYQGIEIMCDTPHAWPPDVTRSLISSVKERLDIRGMGVSNLNAFMMCAIGDFHHPSWIEEDEGFRERRVEHTIACLRLASEWGARTVSTEPGGHLDGLPRHLAMKRFLAGIERAGEVAASEGVRLLVEPEPGLMIETPGQFEEFISQVRSPAIGLNFDLGHLYCVGEDLPALIRRWGSRCEHFHLEDIAKDRKHFHLPPGEGAMDFKAVFAAMRDIRYKGWVTVELYPFLDDPIGVARRAFESLRSQVYLSPEG